MSRRRSETVAPPSDLAAAAALVGLANIGGTLHTSEGERELGLPTNATMDGTVITLRWVLEAVPWPSGTITGFTLRLAGADPWYRDMAPASYGQGDNLTLEQRVLVA